MIHNPVAEMHFKWTWRPYQTRVLQMIDSYMLDGRLHIVAAPGAGKTTLGLEVFRRLGHPAIVLTPTRTIRDQWISRLKDFLPDGQPIPEWASHDLSDLRFFNAITYQALHTRYREAMSLEEEIEDLEKSLSQQELARFIDQIKLAGIGTLILDEAHHLRAEWWKALMSVLEALPDLYLVALTATPPYDVVGHEWQRYQDLCGPIDDEISVPEAVKVGTLCPHQDFVYAIQPMPEDEQAVTSYEQARQQIFRQLLQDPLLLQAVQQHPFLTGVEPDEVLANPALAFAMLAYLKSRGKRLPGTLLKMLSIKEPDVPPMDKRWWQILVQSYLYDNHWPLIPEHREGLEKDLRALGLLWRRELYLDESRRVKQQLSMSAAKVQACVNIYQMERRIRGENLRQVILTDYIREDSLNHQEAPIQLGAFPIFRALLQWIPPREQEKVALLTGRITIVHESRAVYFPDSSTIPFPDNPSFVQLNSNRLNDVTDQLTNLLNTGEIQVLVGTRALLGEGWDAPVVNSLVLASFVGSFMLTNQMRGRAIRVDKMRPEKVSSIWHIVAIDPTSQMGLSDVEDLERRFTTFVGLDSHKSVIESGLKRLHLPRLWTAGMMERNNQTMEQRLRDIDSLHQRWAEATDSGIEGRVIPSITTPPQHQMRAFHLTRTLMALIMEALMIGGIIVLYGLQGVTRYDHLSTLLIVLLISLLIAVVVTLPRFIRIVWLGVRHLPVDGSVRQIALSVRDALYDADLLKTDRRRLKVLSERLENGTYSLALAGGSYYEETLFADSLAQVLGIIENPRYLITRHGRWGRTDYHAVPYVLGVNKERAALFHRVWQQRVSPCTLIYTRGSNGREALLKARANAFSSAASPSTERRDRWQ